MGKLSQLARTLIPSEIIRQGNEINEKIKAGARIFNFTIGDFNPKLFPIPKPLEQSIINAYENNSTNYPPAAGIVELRKTVAHFLKEEEQLPYTPDEILISSGGRPLIYAAYRTVVDKGDKVVYPVPSWNNNHYTHFVEGEHVVVETTAANNFLPTAAELKPHLQDAVLLALCSPLNPTGTMFSQEQLSEICEEIVAINKSRDKDKKPLYLLYDQIYWTLSFGSEAHHHPVVLNPAMKPFTITIDGMSKAFCATGVRVGWSMGPENIMVKMRGMLSHIGAWSPMAEQVASAQYLSNLTAVREFNQHMKRALAERLNKIYEGFESLRQQGFPVEAITPQGAMYLTINIDILGRKDSMGNVLHTTDDITAFLLNEAQLAVVPFKSFGADAATTWYRLSVGVCDVATIPEFLQLLKKALQSLQ